MWYPPPNRDVGEDKKPIDKNNTRQIALKDVWIEVWRQASQRTINQANRKITKPVAIPTTTGIARRDSCVKPTWPNPNLFCNNTLRATLPGNNWSERIRGTWRLSNGTPSARYKSSPIA